MKNIDQKAFWAGFRLFIRIIIIKKTNIKTKYKKVYIRMDFAKGKIYRIYNPNIQDSLEYVGSTSIPYLSTRMGKHRADYKLAKSCRSIVLFDEYGVENCIIELIENYPCADRNELHRREGYYIQERTCVNKCIAGRTTKEYRDANKEKKVIKNKEYREANKEYFNDYHKTYQQTDKYKAYKENNKEKKKAYNKAYRAKQKAELIDKN